MRLIDADVLKKNDELTEWITKDAIRTGKTLKAFSELFVNKIDNAPTIPAIPISVIEGIKAEIEREKWCDKETQMSRNALASGLEKAIKIIDKHIKEYTE